MSMCYSTKGEEEFRKGMQYLTEPNAQLREAMVCFKLAAEQGHLEALYQVGYWNMYGEPQIARNAKEAFECFKPCVEGGLSKAKVPFASFYLLGIHVEKDEKKAFSLLKEAFEKEGVQEAAYFLSLCYADGMGVERDLKKANDYNEIARKVQVNTPCRLAEANLFHIAGLSNDN